MGERGRVYSSQFESIVWRRRKKEKRDGDTEVTEKREPKTK